MDLSTLKGSIPASVIEELSSVIDKFQINTIFRLSHFLGQTAHESGNFVYKVENLNYSADGLTKVFKKYFPTGESAKPYERNQQKIANKVYANRMGNGDEASGDGFKYRGQGYLQLTGKNNYVAFDKYVDEDLVKQPEWVAIKYPLLSAAFFWGENKLNSIADEGVSDDVITKITKRVNGGTHGLLDRTEKTKLYYSKLNNQNHI